MIERQKIILIVALVGVLIVGSLYWLHSEYGIFYSQEKRKEISLNLTEQGEDVISGVGDAEPDFPKTEKIARRALRYDKDNVDAYILLARSLYAQGKLEEAVNAYLKGLEKDPGNLTMNFYIANVYRDLKEFDLCDEYYKKATEIDPHNIVLWVNYAMSYSWDRKDFEGALEIYEQALEKNPDDETLLSKHEAIKKKLEEGSGEE